MRKKITFLLLLTLGIVLTANSQRRTVGVHQLDPRFTFSIEKYWSGMADSEEYFYYVKNNTADEYMLEIQVDLTLNCYDAKPHKLGVNKQVYLKPYGEFTPREDWVHIYMITSDREKQKSCLIPEGNTYTLYRSHVWQILSVVNLTQKKANDEKMKKDKEDARLQQIEADKKASEEKQRQQQLETERIAKQKAAALAQSNTTKSSSSFSGTNTNYNTSTTAKTNTTVSNTQLSEKVKVNGQNVQVFQQNGKNYIKNSDGSVHETTQTAYNQIIAQSDKKKAAATATANTSAQTAAQTYTVPPPVNNYNNATGLYTNPLLNLNTGNSDVDSFAKSYAQGQQIAEVANALVDLFTPSPEEQARKQREREEAERRAEEYRQIERQKRIENENNAKSAFKIILDRHDIKQENDRANIVIWGMDNYISDKYNYDVREMIPDWKKWIIESIQNENKYVSTVFAGKALGLNINKFDYNTDLTTDQAIGLLEKISNSETEYKTFLGINWDPEKKTIKISKPKKKATNKEITVYKILQVHKNTAASENGFQEGDRIIKINNNYTDDLNKTILTFKTGDKIDITFSRNNKEYTKNIALGSVAKDNYNVDAMIILANYYNTKTKGNNPEKALYYFTKAAENGSPNAMYSLGEIYLKNLFGDKKQNVKYKFKKNEEFALEWYNKSIVNTNYQTSHIHTLYGNGTYFEPKAYDELTVMYKKGIGCQKDNAKSIEISNLKTAYLEKLEKEK